MSCRVNYSLKSSLCKLFSGEKNKSISTWEMVFIERDLNWGNLTKWFEILKKIFVAPVLPQALDKKWGFWSIVVNWFEFTVVRKSSANFSLNLRKSDFLDELPSFKRVSYRFESLTCINIAKATKSIVKVLASGFLENQLKVSSTHKAFHSLVQLHQTKPFR